MELLRLSSSFLHFLDKLTQEQYKCNGIGRVVFIDDLPNLTHVFCDIK